MQTGAMEGICTFCGEVHIVWDGEEHQMRVYFVPH